MALPLQLLGFNGAASIEAYTILQACFMLRLLLLVVVPDYLSSLYCMDSQISTLVFVCTYLAIYRVLFIKQPWNPFEMPLFSIMILIGQVYLSYYY